MNILLRVIVSFSLFVFAVLLTAEAVVRIYDGEVVDLPNHVLVISDNGFHFYSKTITHEFRVIGE